MISIRDIHTIVRQYPTNFQSAEIEPLGAAGGMSGAQLWRLSSPAGKLVLRRWPDEHPSADQLRFIHEVLFHAESRGIPFVPVPILTTAERSFVPFNGHYWELTPWMPGASDYNASPNPNKLSAAMTALARFHVAVSDYPAIALPQVSGAAPAVARRLSRLRELAYRGTADLAAAIDSGAWPEVAPLAQQFLALLPTALPRVINELGPLSTAILPVQPCVRDIWHDHVLFTGDEVTGIIDFGAMNIDTPATDVARLLGSLVHDDEDGWQTGLAAYSKVRPLTALETNAVQAIDRSSTVLAGINWLRWLYVNGRQFDDREQVVERFRGILKRTQYIAR